MYWEEEVEGDESDDGEKSEPKNGYDNKNLINTLFYHCCLLIICPFIGLKEIALAGRNACSRDFGWFIPRNWVDTTNGLTRDEMIAQREAEGKN